MKKIHLKLLKKFTPHDIEEMRNMCRRGIPRDVIAKAFNCWGTTVMWWTGDLEQYQKQYVQEID